MSSYAEHHAVYRILNADIRRYPYPHFFIDDVFPAEFFARLREHFPTAESMPPLKTVRKVGPEYPEQRLCVPVDPASLANLPPPVRDFWSETAQWLLGPRFFTALIDKFQPFLAQRFGDLQEVEFLAEALLVDDRTKYWLGPHSDAPKKVITLLFYLPGDLSQEHLGTSIYVPRDPKFRCLGTTHHGYEDFERVYTAPFRPNCLFGFVKSDASFHGVEPLSEDVGCRRQLLLYDINVTPRFALGVHKPPAVAATPVAIGKSGARFSF